VHRAEEVIILSTHLDSVSQDPERLAPGAADNASGVSALLEAARILRHYRFERSLRLIWFTGEEQGMIGSKAYVNDHNLDGILGVINMDMFGYDGDGDQCFELHVGTLPQSTPIGACFRAVMNAYQPGLQVDYLNGYDMGFSDHSSFWDRGIGALEVLENYSYNGAQNGCQGVRDRNPDYHRTTDTIDHLDLDHGFAIAQASLAAGAGMAQPLEACFNDVPLLNAVPSSGQANLNWNVLPDAAGYQVYRSVQGCSDGWLRATQVSSPRWVDRQISAGRTYSYRVEAISEEGACFSLSSACRQVSVNPRQSAPPLTPK
jgi:leucyl aminopeptidase